MIANSRHELLSRPDHKIVDRTKIRDRAVANRPIYVTLAVTVEGRREILGLWAGDGGEGAKHWMHILTEIKNRGVSDVLMLCASASSGWASAPTCRPVPCAPGAHLAVGARVTGTVPRLRDPCHETAVTGTTLTNHGQARRTPAGVLSSAAGGARSFTHGDLNMEGRPSLRAAARRRAPARARRTLHRSSRQSFRGAGGTRVACGSAPGSRRLAGTGCRAANFRGPLNGLHHTPYPDPRWIHQSDQFTPMPEGRARHDSGDDRYACPRA
jgi:hypothetical protein